MGSNELMYQLLKQRAVLEQHKKAIDRRMTDWKEEALPILLATNTKSYKDDEIGSMTLVDGSSVSINRDLLIAALLEEGMEADIVAKVVDKATKVSKYQTVQFKARNNR